MTDDFDAFVDQLQEKIFDETREVFGEKGFQYMMARRERN